MLTTARALSPSQVQGCHVLSLLRQCARERCCSQHAVPPRQSSVRDLMMSRIDDRRSPSAGVPDVVELRAHQCGGIVGAECPVVIPPFTHMVDVFSRNSTSHHRRALYPMMEDVIDYVIACRRVRRVASLREVSHGLSTPKTARSTGLYTRRARVSVRPRRSTRIIRDAYFGGASSSLM